jgi:hypothetical protein
LPQADAVRAVPFAVLLLRRLLPQADAVRAVSFAVLLVRRLLPQADALCVLSGVAGELQLRVVHFAAVTPSM